MYPPKRVALTLVCRSLSGNKHESAATGELGAGDVQLAVRLINESIDERGRLRKEGIFAGAVVTVRVSRLVDFGAFVSFGNGKEGLVHISELDHEHVDSVADYLSVDDEVYAVVLSVDERGRARMSLKDVDQETGVFSGRLDAPDGEDALTGSAPVPEAVSLDDQSLWPSLDGSQNGDADAGHSSRDLASSAGGIGGGGLDQSRQAWKTRIRERREKAAREASIDYGHEQSSVAREHHKERGSKASGGEGRQREVRGPPARQMRPGGVSGGGGGERMQGKDGGLAARSSRHIALADQDYRS